MNGGGKCSAHKSLCVGVCVCVCGCVFVCIERTAEFFFILVGCGEIPEPD